MYIGKINTPYDFQRRFTFKQFTDRSCQNDNEIGFYSLNIAIRNDKRKSVRKYTNPYTFTSFYTDENGFRNPGVNGVLYFLLVN